jgi:hypothetical protein
MWRSLILTLFVAGSVCVSVSQTPKPVSGYTLKSWQNQPGKADQVDHKPVHEGSLMACTNIEPNKHGNGCLLRYEHDGKMSLEFHQTISATSTDEVFLTCMSEVPAEPISCDATVTVLKPPRAP